MLGIDFFRLSPKEQEKALGPIVRAASKDQQKMMKKYEALMKAKAKAKIKK